MNEMVVRPSMDLSRFTKPADLHRKDLHIRGWEMKLDCGMFQSDSRIMFERMSEQIIGVLDVVKFFVQKCDFANYDYAKQILGAYREIPKEVRRTQLFFGGTIWKSGSGIYFISVLTNHHTVEWDLSFYNMDNGIPAGSHVAIAVPIEITA